MLAHLTDPEELAYEVGSTSGKDQRPVSRISRIAEISLPFLEAAIFASMNFISDEFEIPARYRTCLSGCAASRIRLDSHHRRPNIV
jgi:hypothetical protein